VIWQLNGNGPRQPNGWFVYEAMVARLDVAPVSQGLARGRHFLELYCEGVVEQAAPSAHRQMASVAIREVLC